MEVMNYKPILYAKVGTINIPAQVLSAQPWVIEIENGSSLIFIQVAALYNLYKVSWFS